MLDISFRLAHTFLNLSKQQLGYFENDFQLTQIEADLHDAYIDNDLKEIVRLSRQLISLVEHRQKHAIQA